MKLAPIKIVMHKFLYLSSLIIILLLPFSHSLQAQEIPSEPVGHVSDFAGLLSDTERNRLEQDLRNYRDSTTNVIAIATVNSLFGYSKEELATKLFNEWKMWHQDRYNGILILIVPSERAIRIETGYGLEGAFPDAVAKRVIDEIITPNFRQNQYYRGLNEATIAIRKIISGEYTAPPSSHSKASNNADYFEIIKVVAFFAFIFFVLYSTRNKRGGTGNRRAHSLGAGGIFIGTGGHRRSSGGGFSGGGGFGGFSGGGGFGSGGGGAGGSW